MASISKSKPERRAKPAPLKETFSLVSNEKLLAIYAAMVKCRMVQQRAALLFQQGKLASDLHASSGREATAAAIAIDLQPGDSLSLSAGDWLPASVKGMAIESVFRALAPASVQLNGAAAMEQKNILSAGDKAQRPASIRERALAAQAAKQDSLVAAILPSDEQSLKPWHDILAAAASQRLPIVFVHYADAGEQAAMAKPARKSRNPHASFHGVPAISVDALDAVAVYRVAFEAIVRARQGRGATLLECATFAGIPNPGSEKEPEPSFDPLRLPDPLATMEAYLRSKGIEPAQHNQHIVAAFNVELDLATRFLDL
ncbi:MAG TPA: thiamine pyrophosphate-dependent enzyme [Terracidiphilus sp.]|nr:thiamine pyrophosphate-dependent enzyme [Terracidiphilus sp.]